jgi:hypothetical protein
MVAPNEFWLALHALAEAYDGEGLTTDERGANILKQFRRMPPTVRRQVLGDLQRLALHMEDLHVAAQTANRDEESRTPGRREKIG